MTAIARHFPLNATYLLQNPFEVRRSVLIEIKQLKSKHILNDFKHLRDINRLSLKQGTGNGGMGE